MRLPKPTKALIENLPSSQNKHLLRTIRTKEKFFKNGHPSQGISCLNKVCKLKLSNWYTM